MNNLSLKIGGTEVPVPTTVKHISEKAGSFGEGLISLFIELLIVVAIILALFFLVWGGIQWTISGGEKQKVQTARNTIVFSVIGLVLVFLAIFIINIVGQFFGVNLFGDLLK